MRLLVNLLVSALAVFVSAYVLPGVRVDSWLTVFVVAIVLGVVNTVLKPILVLLTLPISIVTLGLFTFVINAAMVLLVSYLVPGFVVLNFWWALIFSLVLAIVSGFLNRLAK